MSGSKVETSASETTVEAPLGPTNYVFHLFAVVSRHREALLETRLKPLGLSLSRHRALSVIAGLGRCTMSELADFTAVDRTTLTRTVDQLVESGLVERATPREDRRQVVLSVTAAGRETCVRSLRTISTVNRELVADMTSEEQRDSARLLEKLLENLVPDPDLRQRLLLRHERTIGWAPRLA